MADGVGDTAFEARRLLRAARSGTLATVADGGQPFASLVTHACAPDLSVLLLLSNLSEHTRHLRAEPRCSILVCGSAERANPQTAPRVTVTGIAEVADDDAVLKARFLAVHPYAAQYADFGDFHLWHIRPMGALFVGGFARAVRLRQAELAPDPIAVGADPGSGGRRDYQLHCNNDHPDALAAIAGAAGEWRLAATDVDGMDLAQDQRVVRVHWSSPVANPADVRTELVRMAQQAREVARGPIFCAIPDRFADLALVKMEDISFASWRLASMITTRGTHSAVVLFQSGIHSPDLCSGIRDRAAYPGVWSAAAGQKHAVALRLLQGREMWYVPRVGRDHVPPIFSDRILRCFYSERRSRSSENA